MAKFSIIFDMDGTIFDTEGIWRKAAGIISRRYGVNLDYNFRLHCCGICRRETEEYMRQKFPGVDAVALRDDWGREVDNIVNARGVKMKRGFMSLLRFLQKNGVRIGLGTGSSAKRVNTYFSRYNLNPEEIFESIRTPKDVKMGKPDPEIYLLVLEDMKLDKNATFIIEDSPNGVIAGANAGCRVLLVPDEFALSQDAMGKVYKKFASLHGVKRFLKKQLKTNKKGE